MKSKKSLFNGLLLTALVAALIMISCPKEPEKEKPTTAPMGNTFNLSGQVHTVEMPDMSDLTNIMQLMVSGITYKPFPGTLDVAVAGTSWPPGKIQNGLLNINALTPAAGDLSTFSESDLKELIAWSEMEGYMIYDDIKFSPSEAKGTVLALEITGSEEYEALAKTNTTFSADFNKMTVTITGEAVNYVYVDRNITVTAAKKTTDLSGLLTLIPGDSGIPLPAKAEVIASGINMSLKTGWNAVYVKTVAVVSMTVTGAGFGFGPVTVTLNVSAANPPSLKWTLIPANDSQYDPETDEK